MTIIMANQHLLHNLLSFCEVILGNYYFLFTIMLASIAFKLYVLITLNSRSSQTTTITKARILLSIVIVGSMFSDFAWILQLSNNFLTTLIDYRLIDFLVRISWAFYALQYQSLAFFIEILTTKKYLVSLKSFVLSIFSTLFFLFFIATALIFFNYSHLTMIYIAQKVSVIYYIFLLMPITLITAFFEIRKQILPKILRQQIKILIGIFVIPSLISDWMHSYPFDLALITIASSFTFVAISTILLNITIYYSIRKVMGLRFLNLRTHVIAPQPGYTFADNFKATLSQLSRVSNMREIEHIAKSFFKEAFNIPLNRMKLFIRSPEEEKASTTTNIAEQFLTSCDNEIKNYIKENNILIYDEIAFTNFYEENNVQHAVLNFLDAISADLFLPIYKQETIIAYIIVDRGARLPHQFYTNVEQDEMVVFVQYIGNIINLLQQRNLEELIYREKELREELYNKLQEINQYKESMKSFIKSVQNKEIGILSYRNRRFTVCNQIATQMITFNLNQLIGHPVAKKLKHLAQQVQEYKNSQTISITDSLGEKLIACGIPHLGDNSVIIVVYYPEISDIIEKQVELLKDPSKWDYLLYLETTKSGKLINQLIPGTSETLLNIKINFLKATLTTKALLLEIPEDDVVAAVEIIHHISLRETLHSAKLKGSWNKAENGIKLFGINPLFNVKSETSLLERIGTSDTLFIQDVHLLDLEAQEHLAELIKYGFYRQLKSDKKIGCSARIICSTNQDLNFLVQEGTFSPLLFNELKKTTIVLPSLLTLAEQDLHELADSFSEQALKNKEIKDFLELTDREKAHLVRSRPVSLHEFKNRVQLLLKQKSHKQHVHDEVEFDPAFGVNNPELVRIARLGKHALRDEKIMVFLWNKFDKNQNKIAEFIGVNRSSVNRRCKKFNLYE